MRTTAQVRRLALVAIALGVLAACSTPAKAPEVASAQRPEVRASAAASKPATTKSEREVQTEKSIQWARCMTEQGFPVPDDAGIQMRGFDAHGQREKMSAAMVACRKLHPTKMYRQLDAEYANKTRKYAACMADEGFTVPVPDANNEIVEDVHFDSPSKEYMRAHVVCRKYLMDPGDEDELPLDDPSRAK